MNPKKFFEKAEQNNISPMEVRYSQAEKLSVKVFNNDLENYQISNDSSVQLRGIYEGKLGSFKSDRTDSKIADMAIESLKASAKYGYEGNPDFFIEKGLTYKRVYGFNRSIDEVKPEDIIDAAKKISAILQKADSRISTVEVEIERNDDSTELYNSKGLSLKSKNNYMFVYAAVNIKDGEQVESAYRVDIISDWITFNVDEFTSSIVKDAQNKLGGTSVPTGKYDVIFDKDLVPELLFPLLEQLSAFEVKEHLSLFEGKVGEQVLSKKLTVTEVPHLKGAFASSFDAEGMPTVKKELISSGVVKTYLYDLETAKNAGVESTGNANLFRGNMRPGLTFTEVKRGRLSLEEMAAKVGKGLYITSLGGISTGLNEQSGDYSLQAEGYLIEDGKIGRPVSLITVAGNLLKDFNKIICVGNDSKINYHGMSAPSIAIRKLAISGN